MGKILRFDSQVSDIEEINPLFSKAKIKVMYTGLNRNQSYISKEAVEKALPTLFNIPIVGEYLYEKDNFGSHGGKIEITDDGVEFIQTTVPFGVVPESASVYWENIMEENGTENEYLIIDGAYLWSGRYDEVKDIHGNFYGQSMEIEIENGNFGIIDGEECFIIEDFVFSGLCILGRDKEGEGHVEPAFESASIIAYSLDENEYKSKFNKMIEELKFSLSQELEGGKNKVDAKLELLKEYSLTEENLKEKEINMEDYSVEELKSKIQEVFSSDEEEKTEEFVLSNNQITKEIKNQLRKETYVDSWGDEEPKYWYVDRDDEKVIVESIEEGFKLMGIPYTVQNDSVYLDFSSQKPVKVVYEYMEDDEEFELTVTSSERAEYTQEKAVSKAKIAIKEEKEQEYTSLKEEFDKVSSELENKTAEVKELLEFKENKLIEERQEKEEALYSQFEGKLPADILNSVREKSSEFTIEELENQLYLEFGKYNASKFSKSTNKGETVLKKVPVEAKTEEKSSVSWAHLMRK